MECKNLIKKAFEAAQNAYAPYSNFKVGAIVELYNGNLIKGCNIENAAYGSTMCAERNAIYQTYCQGYNKDDIKSLTIVSYSKKIVTPCGACRQVLIELMKEDTPIILANETKYIETNIKALLPGAFIKENLHV